MRIFDNDYVIKFLSENGYPPSYNDGTLAWLRAYYGVTRGTLPDLMRKYIKDVGGDQLLIPTSGNIELIVDNFINASIFYTHVITQANQQLLPGLFVNTNTIHIPTVALAASGSSFLLMEDTFSILMEDGFLIELEAT